MFFFKVFSEQDHCLGGKREHQGELHCSRNNQDEVCRGDPLSFNGFIIFELWTKMEDNLIFFPRPWQIMRILPTKRWKTFLLAGESYLAGAMVHWCTAESYLKVCKKNEMANNIFNFRFWLITHCDSRVCATVENWYNFTDLAGLKRWGELWAFWCRTRFDFVFQLNIDTF